MRRQDDISAHKIDWITILLFAVLVLLGWLNIFAAVYDEQAQQNIFDMSLNSGKQLMWIATTVVIITVIMVMDFRFYSSFAYIFYGIIIILLIFVMLFAREVSGARAWLEIGPVKIQVGEFAKFVTGLALAKYISEENIKFDKFKDLLMAGLIIGLPAVIIILQSDTGTAMVFSALVIVMYREGLNPAYLVIGLLAIALFVLTLLVNQLFLISAVVVLGMLIIGLGAKNYKRIGMVVAGMLLVIGVVKSVDFFISDVLQPHQQARIKGLINPDADPLGYGWNVTQSKIAIGSGGFTGKGFLEGTQTKFDFVPEQHTDFIFCTIGEEHGWIGSLVLISLFMTLLLRVVFLAERQKSRFARVYGYSVVSILFFHFMVNIGMTIGLFPVIGIPLPFFSYGGSSLWSFTILLFILIKLDAHRMQVLVR